jgi:hypothetical protein
VDSVEGDSVGGGRGAGRRASDGGRGGGWALVTADPGSGVYVAAVCAGWNEA